jgi:hypothetical protein
MTLRFWRASRRASALSSDLVAAERSAEAWAKRFRASEYVSAAVVLLGVVIDDTDFLSLLFGHASFWSALRGKRLGGAMIAAGIAFEILFSMLVSGREKVISSINAQRRIEAEQQTAEALGKLKASDERIAELNLQAEHERLARAKIEERLSGWSLSTEGQQRVQTRVAPFYGTHFALWVNPIEKAFMEILDAILVSAGWIRDTPEQADNGTIAILLSNKAVVLFNSGIRIEVSKDAWGTLGNATTALLGALNAEGIAARGQVITSGVVSNSAIRIGIGKRE